LKQDHTVALVSRSDARQKERAIGGG
jgi:hypothetical protein